MSALDAVVWDCDGTLVDSEPIGIAVWAELLARFGCETDAADWVHVVGRPFDAFYEYFSQRCLLPSSSDLMDEYLADLYPALRASLRAFDDAVPAVDSIAARRVPMAVASSSHRGRLDLMLELTGLAGHFAVTVAGDEVGRGKPDPDIFERAAASLGVAPGRCLAVEDTVPGVVAARAAGMTVVGVARGARRASELDGAHVVVPGLDGDQLVRWLDGHVSIGSES